MSNEQKPKLKDYRKEYYKNYKGIKGYKFMTKLFFCV